MVHPRLLRLINEAQNDIVIRAKILRDKVTVPIYSNSKYFHTTRRCVFYLDRFLLNNKKLGVYRSAQAVTYNKVIGKSVLGEKLHFSI